VRRLQLSGIQQGLDRSLAACVTSPLRRHSSSSRRCSMPGTRSIVAAAGTGRQRCYKSASVQVDVGLTPFVHVRRQKMKQLSWKTLIFFYCMLVHAKKLRTLI